MSETESTVWPVQPALVARIEAAIRTFRLHASLVVADGAVEMILLPGHVSGLVCRVRELLVTPAE